MKKMFRNVGLLAVLGFGVFTVSGPAAGPHVGQIETYLKQALPTANVGVMVSDAKNGKVLYQKNAYHSFVPASVTKLFTAAAALYKLGPNYHYKTSLYSAGDNFYLKFRGDPSFTHQDLTKLLAAIKAKAIKGDIIIDTRRFKGPDYPFGWMQSDLPWYYAAPVNAIIINRNAIPVILTPNKVLGKLASVRLLHGAEPIKLTSSVRTVTENQAEYHCQLNIQSPKPNTLALSGCWPISTSSQELTFAIRNPAEYTKALIRAYLAKNHIALQGKILVGKAPHGLIPVKTIKSQPLSKLIRAMLKDSINIYAESLVKTLGAETVGVGSTQEGVNAVKRILHKKAGIDFASARLLDGSGSSAYDLLTPDMVNRLLYVIMHDSGFGKLFIASLPESGHRGTLGHRMRSFDLNGRVRAKTGSATGVSNLSGYLKTDKGKVLIFTVFINNFVTKVSAVRNNEDELLSLIRNLFTS